MKDLDTHPAITAPDDGTALSGAHPEAHSMRSDASRNHAAIVSAAISVLSDSSEASMLEIAEASGIGRTTLYRHFPDRRSLIEAILERLIAEVDSTINEVLVTDQGDSPITQLADLICTFAQFGERYRFLQQFPEMTEIRARPGLRERASSKQRLQALVAAGQTDGKIRGDLDAGWLTDVLISLVVTCWRALPAAPRERDRTLRATVNSLLTAP